jgi:transposase InsO family protein
VTRGIPQAVACRALGVSQAWFYKWRHGDRSPRRARRERLKAEVRRLFGEHKGKRGSPMITADLREAGWRVSKNTVAALMAEMGLAARPKKRAQGHHPAGEGPVEGAGPGQAGLPRGAGQRQVVRRRHRYRHR